METDDHLVPEWAVVELQGSTSIEGSVPHTPGSGMPKEHKAS